jgi:hypothetical protein
MSFLAIEHLWGNLWTVEEMDLAGFLARVILSILLAVFTIAVVAMILVPLWLVSRLRESTADAHVAAQLPPVRTVLGARTPTECPNCGNTSSLDIRPCIRCGVPF